MEPRERSRAAVDYYRLGKTAQSSSNLAVAIPAPALIIYGEDEPKIRKAAFGNALSVVGEGSKLVEISGAGHWPHLEAPEQCSTEVEAFLQKQRGL